MLENKEQQTLSEQINDLCRSREFDKALEISEQVLESNPPDLKAYNTRWELMTDIFSETEAKERIYPEIETVLQTHPESSDLYYTVHMGYKRLPGRAKNVPIEIFNKMLNYPGTDTYLVALLELAELNEDEDQQWHYNERVINECTITDGPSTWYMAAYENMLRLVERNRSLADGGYIDELIDGLMNAHLYYCNETQQKHIWAYTNAVKYRIKLSNRLDKALKTLDRAEIRLEEKEEQEWLERKKGSLEYAYEEISRLRGKVYYHQEKWREAHDSLNEYAPDFLDSFWARFGEETIDYLYMLGRSAEGIENWEKAKYYYADAHFAPTPHPDAQSGLKRVYQQIKKRNPTTTFEAFLKDTEAEYEIRKEADRIHICQQVLSKRINEKAEDFRLETLDGESYTLSDMSGKVVLLDVSASWCGPCNLVVPQLKLVYKHFSMSKDFVFLGVNNGEKPEQVQKSLDEHNLPWPVLLDPDWELAEAYNVRSIPYFILIDKNGYWQYTFKGLHIVNGQPLICMIESLLSD